MKSRNEDTAARLRRRQSFVQAAGRPGTGDPEAAAGGNVKVSVTVTP